MRQDQGIIFVVLTGESFGLDNTWFAGASEGAHGVSADCVGAAVVGEVAISALVHIDTALVGLMVPVT